MAFTAYHLTQGGDLRRGLNEEQIRSAFVEKDGLLWVDICETTEEDGRFLERTFNFHHLLIEDCLSKRLHPPKIDDFDDYIFIAVHGIDHTIETNIVETAELQIFLGSHFVVSNHIVPLFSVKAVRRLVEEHGRPMRRGADFLAHALVDALIDNILPTIDAMGERANDIEEEVIRNPQRSTLEAILHLKRSALQLHRIVAPQREVLNRLSRQEFPTVSNEARIFYRDIYDHILRIEDLNQSLRDRAADALSTYLSVVANRQNETMRVLSIVATIFLPLMLLAGIYGMNFEQMPELKWGWSYYAVLGFMGTVIVGALLWFRARAWITWGQQEVARLRPFMVDRKSLVGYLDHISMPSHRDSNKQPTETEPPVI
ncbi:MAG: magnesium and cobalt transport protein CorA [Chloroflexi bacterium RBG_13_53_26]|nr:MAG: magnesium and cobalt transport protein CorA [Chloroflexi bacterium RBG_13_53_26]